MIARHAGKTITLLFPRTTSRMPFHTVLPPELVCLIFHQSQHVLLGRATCRRLREILSTCGSQDRPLFLRALVDGASLDDFAAMAAFMRSFRHAVVLIVRPLSLPLSFCAAIENCVHSTPFALLVHSSGHSPRTRL